MAPARRPEVAMVAAELGLEARDAAALVKRLAAAMASWGAYLEDEGAVGVMCAGWSQAAGKNGAALAKAFVRAKLLRWSEAEGRYVADSALQVLIGAHEERMADHKLRTRASRSDHSGAQRDHNASQCDHNVSQPDHDVVTMRSQRDHNAVGFAGTRGNSTTTPTSPSSPMALPAPASRYEFVEDIIVEAKSRGLGRLFAGSKHQDEAWGWYQRGASMAVLQWALKVTDDSSTNRTWAFFRGRVMDRMGWNESEEGSSDGGFESETDGGAVAPIPVPVRMAGRMEFGRGGGGGSGARAPGADRVQGAGPEVGWAGHAARAGGIGDGDGGDVAGAVPVVRVAQPEVGRVAGGGGPHGRTPPAEPELSDWRDGGSSGERIGGTNAQADDRHEAGEGGLGDGEIEVQAAPGGIGTRGVVHGVRAALCDADAGGEQRGRSGDGGGGASAGESGTSSAFRAGANEDGVLVGGVAAFESGAGDAGGGGIAEPLGELPVRVAHGRVAHGRVAGEGEGGTGGDVAPGLASGAQPGRGDDWPADFEPEAGAGAADLVAGGAAGVRGPDGAFAWGRGRGSSAHESARMDVGRDVAIEDWGAKGDGDPARRGAGEPVPYAGLTQAQREFLGEYAGNAGTKWNRLVMGDADMEAEVTQLLEEFAPEELRSARRHMRKLNRPDDYPPYPSKMRRALSELGKAPIDFEREAGERRYQASEAEWKAWSGAIGEGERNTWNDAVRNLKERLSRHQAQALDDLVLVAVVEGEWVCAMPTKAGARQVEERYGVMLPQELMQAGATPESRMRVVVRPAFGSLRGGRE